MSAAGRTTPNRRMRYKETREQSAELLRMVLPQMARHATSFNPMTYAVWYEYLARINPHLNAALDARLAESNSLCDDDIAALHDRYLAPRDAVASAHVSAEMARLVDQFGEAANEAGEGVRSYGVGLESFRQQLQSEVDQHRLDQMVRSLISDTARLRSTTEVFHQQLSSSSQEITELRTQLEIAQGLACRDPLTGLLNRRGFDQQLQHDWVNCGAEGSLLIVDIDQFKNINDAHGHMLGDKVIVAVARALHACCGERGPVARIGGEEFAALLLQSPLEAALSLAEKVRSAVERGRIRRTEDSESIGGVTVSIGVAMACAGEPFESLMLRADRALYQSKAGGRNRITPAEAAQAAQR